MREDAESRRRVIDAINDDAAEAAGGWYRRQLGEEGDSLGDVWLALAAMGVVGVCFFVVCWLGM